MSFTIDRNRGKTGYAAAIALRSENLRLRTMLERAEAIATRYAFMLREGDHRIKNSLQIVSSLMGLQAHREESVSAREALRTAAGRIQSVARMHDALQASGGEDSLNLGEVIEKMCGSLHAMGGEPLAVAVRVSADPVQTPSAVAQPIVLAVNELVVNALRHGFPNGRTGSITVKLTCASGQLRVVVADDGVGLPAGHSDGNGYGMKLVRMMTKQIGGELHVDSTAGTRITIIAPAPGALALVADQVKAALVVSACTAPEQSEGSRRPGKFPARLPWRANGRG